PVCRRFKVRWALHKKSDGSVIPRLGQGGVAATSRKMLRSLLVRSGRGGSFNYRLIGDLNQPPRPLHQRKLRLIFFMSRPPLLGQGGEFTQPCDFLCKAAAMGKMSAGLPRRSLVRCRLRKSQLTLPLGKPRRSFIEVKVTQYYRIHEFAELAGVTVKALRHYD